MSDKHIIAFTGRADSTKFIQEVAQHCEAELRVFARVEQVIESAINSPDILAVFLDFSTPEQIQRFEGLVTQRIDRNKVHMMVFAQDVIFNRGLLENSAFGHLIIKKLMGAKEDAHHYSRIIEMTNRPKPFGLKSIISPNGKIEVFRFKESNEKSAAVDTITRFLQRAGYDARVSMAISGAVDELLISAMFDAPLNERGEQIHAQLSRATNIELTGVEMHFAMEGDLIAITVTDSNGSLNRSGILKDVEKLFREKSPMDDTGLGGSALGLVMILRTGGSLVFVSEPGQKTEVTVLFRKAKGFLELKSQFQFVSTFVVGS